MAMKLLFCDTFSQEPADGSVISSWAAIDFPCPVVLEEIRVLPKGVRLHEQLGADGQIGKTSPIQFRIDFFASDANNNTCSTFENLCTLEYQENASTSVLPRLPFVTDKLVCSGWYQAVSIAVFGAEASDMAGVRAIRERREMDMKGRPRALLPTPPDSFRNNDNRISAPQEEREAQPFHGSSREPPPHLGQNVPQYQDAGDAASSYPVISQHNFQKPFNDRSYRNRQPEDLQFQRDRAEPPGKRFPLLPTPGVSGEVRDKQHQHGNRYQADSYSRGQPGYPNQDVQQDWSENRRKFHSPNYSSDGGHRAAAENAMQTDEVVSDHEARSNYHQMQNEDEEWADVEYEEISDEEILDEEATNNMEDMVEEDMLLPSSMMTYNPFDMISYPVTHYKPPDITNYETLHMKLLNENNAEYVDEKTLKEVSQENEKLLRLISLGLKFCPISDPRKFALKCGASYADLPSVLAGKEKDWVSTMEKISAHVNCSLPHLQAAGDDVSHYSTILVVWVVMALSTDGPIAKIIGVNVRALKAGLSLALKLCRTSGDVAEQLVHVGLAEKVLRIINEPHIASSIKICAVHVLDAITDWPQLTHRFLFGDDLSHHAVTETIYVKIVELALLPHAARVAAALTQLLRKTHVYECMHQVKVSTRDIVEKMPDEYAYVMDDEDDGDEEDYLPDEEVEMVVMSLASGDEEDEDREHSVSQDNGQNKTLSDHGNLRIVHESGQRKVFGVSVPGPGAADQTDETGNNSSGDDNAMNDVNLLPMKSVFSMDDVTVTEETLLQIADSLDEITNALKRPQCQIGQFPIRTFPASGLTLSESDDSASCVALFRMSESTNLLASVQALLTLPIVSGHRQVFGACCGYLDQLMSSQPGLLHLAANADSVIHIIRHLLKSAPKLDTHTPGSAGYMGAQLAFHLQCMQSIDHIWSLLDSEADEEDVEEELVHAFRTLFSLTYVPLGRHCVGKVLSIGDHLQPIMVCLWYPRKLSDFVPEPVVQEKVSDKESEDKKSDSGSKTTEEGSDAKEDEKPEPIQHRTAVNQYAASVLSTVLLRSENVSYLFKHKDTVSRACLSEMHSIPRLDSIRSWLQPLKEPLSGEESDVEKLVGFMKSELEHLEWSSFTEIGPKLCTTIRLLCHLCKTENAEEPLRSESRLPIMRMFSVNGLNVLLSLLERMHAYLQSACRGTRVMSTGLPVSVHGTVTSLLRNSVCLMLQMLSQLLDAGIESKTINGQRISRITVTLYSDVYILLRPIDPLLLDDITGKFVSVLSLFFAHDCCSDLTAPVLTEIIKHAESQCDNFAPALTLLAQLLPMPLPIVSPDVPTEEARTNVAATCKRWAGHLSPFVDRVLALLLPLSSSTCRPLLNVIIALCQQMIDLSPDLAQKILKKYKEEIAPLLVNTAVADEEGKEVAADENSGEKELMLSPEQVTTIENLAEIITMPSAKAALICSMHEDGDGMLDLWQYASSNLSPKDAVSAVLLLASVLIDDSVSLNSNEHLAVSDIFPPTVHLRQIAVLAAQQLTSSSEAVYCRSLLVFSHLLQTRSSSTLARNALVRRNSNLLQCIQVMAEHFDHSNAFSVGAAVNLMEVLSTLVEPESVIDDCSPDADAGPRRPWLSKAQLDGLLEWNGTDTHPLIALETSLAKNVCDLHSDAEFVLDRLVSLRQSLVKQRSPALDVDATSEVEFPAPTSLIDQFAARPLFAVGDDDEALNIRLSLTGPTVVSARQSETKNNFVQCDLVATAEKFCPGYDLADQLGRLAKTDSSCDSIDADLSKSRRPVKIEAFSRGVGKKSTYMKRSHGQLMSQPRIGRGRGRGSANNRPFDLFRHRKQNTSRPPSMHVDDFMAADEEQQQTDDNSSTFKSPQLPPAALPQQRRQPPQSFKRTFTPRGRGRGRGGSFGRPGRVGLSYGSAGSTMNRHKSKLSAPIRGRVQDRYRGGGATNITSRLGFSPRENFKTNKTESWNGPRNFSQSGGQSPSPRGRGAKISKYPRPFLTQPYASARGKQWNNGSQFSRRGRGYNKPRGSNKHSRSFTR